MPLPQIPNVFEHLPRFGNQLHDLRTLRGITVEEVAEAAGLAPKALREIESGVRPAPSINIVNALADALHLGADERKALISAAKLDDPVIGAALGRQPPTMSARPTMSAAILVFLIADIRGYTRFTREQGDEAAAQLTERFADLARSAAEQWGGQLVEVRGDEVVLVFASARQAVRAAHELQSRYADEVRTRPDLPVGIGIGLDLGEPVPVDEGYRGAALNRAARLCSLAAPGEVLVSLGVAYVVPEGDGVRFVPRGQEQLKGYDTPVTVLLASTAPTSVVEAGEDLPHDE
jgi:class 3 adenylate cyclase